MNSTRGVLFYGLILNKPFIIATICLLILIPSLSDRSHPLSSPSESSLRPSDQPSSEYEIGMEILSDHENCDELTATRMSRDEYNGLMDYGDVVLIVNDNSRMSKDISDYFLSKRQFPQQNVINITVPSSETISRTEFNEMRRQIEDNITSRNLTTKINYIVTTKGVPLRISGTGRASVDSELALILGGNQGGIGGDNALVNPYYNKEGKFDSEKYQMYLVTRLTAYTLDEAKALIERSSVSLNVTGKFILDVDPGRDGSPGYKIGNDGLRGANNILTARGFDILHDETNTFVSNITNVGGYASWGSNDGHWFKDLVSNSNMETDSNGDGVPDNWFTITGASGIINRTDDDAYRNIYSVNITRSNPGPDTSALFQNISIEPNSRYYLSGYANLSGVSGEGSAHIQVRAHNALDDIIWIRNGSLRTGTTAQWTSMGQIIFEPIEGVRKLSVGALLSRSAGTVHFDHIRFNEIRPHLEFVPGAIAETFVSTGGRSFTYGTSYGQSLVADLIREGVTGVKGYTWEPYMNAICHPDILFDRYTSGHNLAQSFWSGSNLVSWMGTVVGDPKCCPYRFNRADLSITDIAVSDDSPRQGDEIYINVTIENIGGTATPVFDVVLGNGTGPWETIAERYLSLGSGDSSTISFRVDLSDMGGSNDLVVVADQLDSVMEIFEDNNYGTLELYVNNYPSVNRTLPVIYVQEDSFNNSLDLSKGYFFDVESDDLYYSAMFLNPTADQTKNVHIDIRGTTLNVTVSNNFTDDHVPIRICCSDKIPIGSDVYQDTHIRIMTLNDRPFLLNRPVPIVLDEDTLIVSDQLKGDDIFDDIDSRELYYSLVVDPYHYHSEKLGDKVDVFLNEFDDIVVDAGGDFFGNITLRVYCSDSIINETDGLVFADLDIVIIPVNDPPRFNSTRINVSVPEDSENMSALDLSAVCFDVDNEFEELKWYVLDVSPSGIGTFDVINGFLMVSLEENYTSDVVLVLKVSDGKYSNSDSIYIEIIPVNDPPAITPKDVVSHGDGNITVEFAFFDSDSPPGNMTLEVTVNGSLLFTREKVEFRAFGDNSYVVTFTFHPAAFNLSSGNHSLELKLTDIENASGMAEVIIRVPDVDDASHGVDDDEDDDVNGTGDDGDNDHDGDGGGRHGQRDTICIIALFGVAALGIVGAFIYLHRKKRTERARIKKEKEEKWRIIHGDGSNAQSIPRSREELPYTEKDDENLEEPSSSEEEKSTNENKKP